MKKITLKTKIIATTVAFCVLVSLITLLLNVYAFIVVLLLSVFFCVAIVRSVDIICNTGVLDLKLIAFSRKLIKLCKEAKNIVIMGHKFSDLDSIGASYGLYTALRGRYDVKMLLNKEDTLGRPLIDLLCYGDKECKFYGKADVEDIVGENTLLIIVDTHRPQLMDFESAYEKAGKVAIIDHHLKAADFADRATDYFLKTTSSSACEIVAAITRTLNPRPIGKIAANALLSGIMLDTKNFVINTGADTFRISSYLRQQKASPKTVKQLFSESIEVCKRKYEIVASAVLYDDCAISKSEINDNYSRVCAAQAADELLTVTGVRASFVMCPSGDKINISARSFGDIDVKKIVEKLGGGGHKTVAACQINAENFDSAYKLLQNAINEYKKER